MKSALGYRRSWRLKNFSILSSGRHLVYWSETILAILVWSHLGNIPVKFESHWPKVEEELAIKTNCLTTHDGHRLITIAHHEYVNT